MKTLLTILCLSIAATVIAAPPPPLVRNTYTTNYCTDLLINCRGIVSANVNTSIVVNSQWNTIDNANLGAVISGGLFNSIAGPASDVCVIGGGNLNSIAAGSDTSVIGGGAGNNINANDTDCVISGGFLNLIDVGTYNSIAGGTENAIMIGDFSAIGGGAYNVITLPAASAGYSVIAGGEGNTIQTHQSVISGGASNLLLHSVNGFSAISGGLFNESSGDFTSLMGGALNTNSGDYSSIIGGYSNRAEGTYSVAAGRSAHSMQNGSWTFKDSSATPYINNEANSLQASFSGGYDFMGGGNFSIGTNRGPGALTVRTQTWYQPVFLGFGNITNIGQAYISSTATMGTMVSLGNSFATVYFLTGNSQIRSPHYGGIEISDNGLSTDRYWINGLVKPLTDEALNAVFYIESRTNLYVAGQIIYALFANNGTERQVLSGTVRYAGINTNGVWSDLHCVEDTTDDLATSVTSGTLTAVWSIAAHSSGPTTNVAIKVTPTSSLIPTEMHLRWQIQNNGTNLVKTI